MKHLLKGKYYWHFDSSYKRNHPSYIYQKNDKKNKYHIVSFTSSPGKHRTKLNRNIDPNSYRDCYALKSPTIVKRNSFGKELKGCKVVDKTDKLKIKMISKKKR